MNRSQVDGRGLSRHDLFCALPAALNAAMDAGDVKLAMSGHIHPVDDIRIFGKRLLCSGSASAAEWRGPDHETRAGFGVVDVRADGTLEYAYHEYGWQFE